MERPDAIGGKLAGLHGITFRPGGDLPHVVDVALGDGLGLHAGEGRHRHRHKEPDDHDHDHDLDEGEPAPDPEAREMPRVRKVEGGEAIGRDHGNLVIAGSGAQNYRPSAPVLGGARQPFTKVLRA
jgi:hypothetical protein